MREILLFFFIQLTFPINGQVDPGTRYAITAGNWNDGSTWSYTSGGASCNCIPNATSDVYTNGNNVTINADADANNIAIEDNTNLLFSGNYNLTLHNGGSLTIGTNARLDQVSTNSSLIFDNGTDFSLIINSDSAIIINNLHTFNISSLTLSGSGSVIINNNIEIDGSNTVLTNYVQITTENINANDNTNRLVNENTGEIKINTGIDFNLFSYILENNGTINLDGNFFNVGAGSVQVYNYEGSSFYYAGDIIDTDLEFYCNYVGNTFFYDRSGNQEIFTPRDAYWNLYLSGTGEKYMLGDFNIANDFLIFNSGITFMQQGNYLYLGGNWRNAGNYDNSGTVHFYGSNSQYILNNYSNSEQFENLIVNKINAELILRRNVTVTAALDLQNGVVNAASNGRKLYLSNPDETSLIKVNGWIHGKFEREINTTNTYDYPLGTNTEYFGAQLQPATISPGSLIMEYINNNPGENGLPVIDGTDTINQILQTGYWTLSANTFSTGNFDIRLDATNFSPTYLIDESIRILHRENGGPWTGPNIPGTHGIFNDPFVERTNVSTGILETPNTTEFGLGGCTPPIITSEPANLTDQCVNSDVFFSITASDIKPISYQWFKDGMAISDTGKFTGTNTDTLRISGIDSTYAGNYYCIADNECSGGTQSAIASLTLLPSPVITIQPQSENICFGEAYTITISATGGDGTIHYQWQKSDFSGAIWTDIGGDSASYNTGVLFDTTYYRVIVSSGEGECSHVTSNEVMVAVYNQLIGGTIGSNQSICFESKPESFTNDTSPSGGTGLTYQWFYDNGAGWIPIPEATQLTYSDTNNLLSDTYYRRLTTSEEGCGSSNSNIITVSVYDMLDGGIIGSNQTICYNSIPETFTNDTSPGGGVGLTYQWQYDDGNGWSPIQGATQLTYAEQNNITTDINYRRKTTSGAGCGETYSNVVTVETLDSIYILDRIINNNICYGDSNGYIELIVGGGQGSPPYSYIWEHDTTNKSNIANMLPAGIYTVSVFDGFGCILNDTITIEQPNKILPIAQLSNYHGYEISCKNASDGEISITTSGGTGRKDYSWTYNGTQFSTDSILTGLVRGIYSLTVQDNNNCVVIEEYELIEPDSLIIISFMKEDKFCSTPGIGEVIVSGGVPVNSSPGNYYYLWSNGETTSRTETLETGEHQIEITDWNGCKTDSSFTILFYSEIEIGIEIVQPVSCNAGNDGIIKVIPILNANPPFPSVTWNGTPGGSIYYGASAGTYIAEVFDSKGCFDTDTFELIQPDSIVADFTPFQPSCYGFNDGYILLNASGGNGSYSYAYNDSILDSDIAGNLYAGTYQFMITDSKNCTGEATITITQPDELIITELVDERTPPTCPDLPDGTIVVTAQGGNEEYTFMWEENQTTGNTITGIKEGYYGVSVTDANGCTSNETIFLEAEHPECLIIPSAISPNGDQINDFWDIVSLLDENNELAFVYPEMIVKIYNRWGKMVWESKRGYPRSEAWKGTDRAGRELPVDSYHYIIYLNNESGVTLKGSITIIK